MEIVQLDLGQVIQVHERTQCIGTWCAIHQQMPGPWSSWPRWWVESTGVMQRICSHGTGHPVAEMYPWAIAEDREHLLLHPCCGCPCTPQPIESDDRVTIYLPVDRADPSVVEKLNQNKYLDLRKELLDLVIALWPTDSHATVNVSPQLGRRLQRALLAACDELEEHK